MLWYYIQVFFENCLHVLASVDPRPNNRQSNMKQASLFPSHPTAKICIFVLLWKCGEDSGCAIVCQD